MLKQKSDNDMLSNSYKDRRESEREREINLHKSCDGDQTLLHNFFLINLNHVVEQQQKQKK